MKKRYISPDILLTELSVCQIICASGGVDKQSISNEGSEDMSRASGWDDDDY